MGKGPKTRISKRQQAANKKAGLIELWTDGSFFDQTGAAGGAGIYTNSDGKRPSVLCWTFNNSEFDISLSGEAELWAATIALENAEPQNVGMLYSDCPFVHSRINDIRAGTLNRRRYDSELYARLEKALSRQPQMATKWVKRDVRFLPIANAFAQSAAQEDIEEMNTQMRRFRIDRDSFYEARPGAKTPHNG